MCLGFEFVRQSKLLKLRLCMIMILIIQFDLLYGVLTSVKRLLHPELVAKYILALSLQVNTHSDSSFPFSLLYLLALPVLLVGDFR